MSTTACCRSTTSIFEQAAAVLRHLLDSNILSAIARDRTSVAVKRLAQVGEHRVATSVIVACELRFGLARVARLRIAAQVERLLQELPVLPLEPPVDEHYAEIRAALERAGTPIGPNDLLIAAQARALGLTLVTGNVREFSRVPGLLVDNWLE